MPMLSKEEVRKIGVLRANAIGDFIVTLPALHSLKRKFPEAELVLLGNSWMKTFLEEEEIGIRRSPVDRVIVIPITKGLREEKDKTEDPLELENFFNTVSRENFDILLNFQGKGVTGIPFLKKLGAKWIAGLGSEDSDSADQILHYYYYQPESLRFMEMVSLIGADPVTLKPELKLLKRDLEEAENVINELSLKNFLVLHPSGTDKRRMWSPGNVAKLADTLSQKGYQVVFTGTKQDEDFLKQVFSLTHSDFVNLIDKFSLGGLAAFFNLSKLLIAIDTGPLHLAQAVGANTVGLYWGPNMINWAPLTRKNHRPVINWELRCPHCGVKPLDPFPFEPVISECRHDHFFLDGISITQVMREVEYLLNNNS